VVMTPTTVVDRRQGGWGGGGLGLTWEGMMIREGEKRGVAVTVAPFNGVAGEG
jgi:hypothetical protein